jgi:hypothetical protein
MKLKLWIASILLAFAPAVASAITLTEGPTATGVDSTTAQTFTYDLSAAAPLPLAVRGLTLTFNNTRGQGGVSAITALSTSTWTFTAPGGAVTGPTAFAPITGSAAAAAATVFLPDFVVDPGQSFTLSFNLTQPGTSGSFSFAATPVPLPAAGWMLLSAMGGVAFISRRRKAA